MYIFELQISCMAISILLVDKLKNRLESFNEPTSRYHLISSENGTEIKAGKVVDVNEQDIYYGIQVDPNTLPVNQAFSICVPGRGWMFLETINIAYFRISGVLRYNLTIPGAGDTFQVSLDSSPFLIRFRGSKLFLKCIIYSIFRRI